VRALFVGQAGNGLRTEGLLGFDEVNEQIWDLNAEIFLPCAASRLVTLEQVSRLRSAGLELISAGANVPFADPEIFYGPTYEFADQNLAVIPDFIANCGMARAFTLLMGGIGEVTDEVILGDVSRTIRSALERCHERSPASTALAATALTLALDQLV
jgi:glutamate dehydrogenase/leucine dehydrogenase